MCDLDVTCRDVVVSALRMSGGPIWSPAGRNGEDLVVRLLQVLRYYSEGSPYSGSGEDG